MKRRSLHASPKTVSLVRPDGRTGLERSRQHQTVAINRGLFLVRYASADDEQRPPTIRISPSPTARKHLQFVLHPDFDEAVLLRPDSTFVVRATKPSMLTVQVIASHTAGSTAATVRIEPLTQDKEASLPVKEAASLQYDLPQPYDPDDFRIHGHLSGTGDVLVNAGEWLAGPSAPSRIEGLSIEWPSKPADLNISYGVKTAAPQAVSGRKMGLGSFVGTRGKAMPIVGLLIEMSGADPYGLHLFVEAIFLGGPVIRLTGNNIVASGPTGREPLVGLRMKLETVDGSVDVEEKTAVNRGRNSESRVRVFRSLSKPSHQVPM